MGKSVLIGTECLNTRFSGLHIHILTQYITTNSIHYLYILYTHIFYSTIYIYFTFYWGRSWRRDTKCDCKIDWLWVRSPLEDVKYLFTLKIFSERSHPERSCVTSLNGEWSAKCLITNFLLLYGKKLLLKRLSFYIFNYFWE